jgi:hypothetical protein
MLKLNLLLIQKAPLNYLLEVIRAFGSNCFPASRELANLGSRSQQLTWVVLHFFLIGGFAFNLILLLGAAIYINACNLFGRDGSRLPPNEARITHFQAFMYGLAGTIVIYTAAISCFIDAGDPRHRVPTDVLIVFMLFLGTHLWRGLVDLSRTVMERTQADTESRVAAR